MYLLILQAIKFMFLILRNFPREKSCLYFYVYCLACGTPIPLPNSHLSFGAFQKQKKFWNMKKNLERYQLLFLLNLNLIIYTLSTPSFSPQVLTSVWVYKTHFCCNNPLSLGYYTLGKV